ncbi:MAG: peptidylprolyl isomerase [Planctomycetaceae bacterium]|nr:peptidylprolyl isomerase [Planctomycetaceae bacterium]
MKTRFLRVALLLTLLLIPQALHAQKSLVVATVNGEKIDKNQLHLYLLIQGIPEKSWSDFEKPQLEQLIDRTIMRQFLKSRNFTAPQSKLDHQLARIEKVLQNVESPEELLKQLGMTRKDLEQELSVSLAWKRYVREITKEEEIAEYFEKHRSELDGTQRQARQIFLKLPQDATDSQITSAIKELAKLKQRIERKEFSFQEAARNHSQSPSREQGGDLGTFAFTGQMPVDIARAVFQTEVGQMSKPFSSKYGVHMIYVDREIPGLFSLEDARPEILSYLIDSKWHQKVKRLRKSARISYGAK